MKTQKDQDDIVYKEAFNVVKANFLRRIEEAREKENPENTFFIAMDCNDPTDERVNLIYKLTFENEKTSDSLYKLMQSCTDLNEFVTSAYVMLRSIEDFKRAQRSAAMAMMKLHGADSPLAGLFSLLDEEFKKHRRDEDNQDNE